MAWRLMEWLCHNSSQWVVIGSDRVELLLFFRMNSSKMFYSKNNCRLPLLVSHHAHWVNRTLLNVIARHLDSWMFSWFSKWRGDVPQLYNSLLVRILKVRSILMKFSQCKALMFHSTMNEQFLGSFICKFWHFFLFRATMESRDVLALPATLVSLA